MAPRIESLHLPDLLGDADEAPTRVQRLAAHYGDIVRFASQLEPGEARLRPVTCRLRPNRRVCYGVLLVEREVEGDRVLWRCHECGAAGSISGWQGTAADLRAMRRRPSAELFGLEVDFEVFAVLREVSRDDPELGRITFSALLASVEAPLLLIDEEDAERLASHLAVVAMKTGNRRKTALLMSLVDYLVQPPGGDDVADLFGDDGLDDVFDEEALDDMVAVEAGLGSQVSFPPVAPPRGGKGKKATKKAPPRPRTSQTFRIKVTLRDTKPPIWRRLEVPGDILLPKLHRVLQVAMGWTDSHLHLFRVGQDCYAPPGDWEPVGADSRQVALVDLAAGQGARLVYEYDFGDGWTHDILVEAVVEARCDGVRLLGGRRRCPPENCGGPWGYQELLEAMADPSHERHAEVVEWVGEEWDAKEFEVEEVAAELMGVRVR